MMESRKIVVFYYTQSGQALDIAKSICKPLATANAVIYKEIVPEKTFRFPWNYNEFFDIFPETRLGIPPFGIKEIDLSDVQDADLVIIVGQSWFLSPSLPIQSFLASAPVREYLKGRNVVFVNGCRNMWVNTFFGIRKALGEIGARFVGHIVLQDRAHNLVGIVTIARWLLYGKKEATGIWPAAGVSDADIAGASRFGEVIGEVLQTDGFGSLQQKLMNAGAIDYVPKIVYVEKVGHRIFGIWAKFIRKKGEWGNPARTHRCTLFSYYLFFVLYVVSPIVLTIYHLLYPIRYYFMKRNRLEICYNLGQ